MVEEFEEFLSRVKRVEKKIMNYVREEFREVLEGMRDELHSISSMFEPSWSYEGYLRPLYTIKDVGNAYVVYLDLPKADLGTVDVRFRDNFMVVRAKLKGGLRLGCWSCRGGEITFHEYREVISLPFKVDPSKVKVELKGDRVKVIISKE